MSKIKVSHTIDEDLVEWMDSEIAKKRFASRSHAIEYAIKQLIEGEKPLGIQKPTHAHVIYPQSQDLGLAVAEKGENFRRKK